MRFNDIKSLHKCVVNDLDMLLSDAKDRCISLSDLLEDLLPDEYDVVKSLLEYDGITVERRGNKSSSTLRDLNEVSNKYRRFLFSSYLDKLYKSCFDSTRTYIGINDLVAYRQYSNNLYERPNSLNLSDVLDECDFDIAEGYAIPCTRLTQSEYVVPFNKMALGLEYHYEMLRKSDVYLHEIGDYTKQIGFYHNKSLVRKFLHLLQESVKPISVRESNNISEKGIAGINELDYFSVNNMFTGQAPGDTVVGSILPTLKFLITHKKVRELRESTTMVTPNNYDTIFGSNKEVLALENDTAKNTYLDDKLIVYNKETSISLSIYGIPDEVMDDRYSSTDIYVRRYFGMTYSFNKNDNITAVLCDIESNVKDETDNDKKASAKGFIAAALS